MVNWENEYHLSRYTFTLMEIRDLLISIIVLGFMFSAALSNFQVEQNTPFVNFLTAMLIVGPALLFHELAHKIMAQRYGCKASYVLWPMGVIFSVMLTILTAGRIIFAALGAVMISTSYTTRLGYRFIGLSSEELGKIALSGPFTNIIIAVVSYAFIWVNPQIIQAMITINLIVALFNALPFPPLDGAKIFSWSKLGWLDLLASAIILLYLPPVIGVMLSIIVVIVLMVLMFIFMQMSTGLSYVSHLKMP